jgi:uncharacterized protein YndB with AHSA1/START domain
VKETADTVTFATFSIERTYAAKPARVFAAFANPESKRKWFAEGSGQEVESFELDFRVGGMEKSRFRFKGGPGGPGGILMGNDTVFQDIVEGRRVVFAYVMTMGDKRFSASLGTVELFAEGEGTKLLFTEQAAFFPGGDGVEMRKGGWTALFGKLAQHLAEAG